MGHLRFSVTVFVLLALTLVVAVRLTLSGFIPKPPPNALRDAYGDYLTRARFQPVKWRVLDNSAVAHARRVGRPILMVIGTPWSEVGRKMDNEAFSDPDLAFQINRQFVPVRVDGAEHPEWLGAFLPISRQEMQLTDGFQIWALAPDGTLLDFLGRWKRLLQPNKEALVQMLGRVPEIYEQKVLKDVVPELETLQQADLRQLVEQSQTSSLSLDSYLEAVDRGFAPAGIQRVHPQLLDLLVSHGRVTEAHDLAQAILKSPLYDALDGGLFRTAVNGQVEFDKVAVQQAEFAESIANIANRSADPLMAAVARDLIRGTLRTFRSQDGWGACVLGTKDDRNRHPRYSLLPTDIDQVLTPADARWTLQNLMDPMNRGSQLLLRPRSCEILLDPRYGRIRDRLLASKPPAQLASVGLLDHTANSAAALMRAAFALGDSVAVREIGRIVDQLEGFRRKGRLLHRSFPVEVEANLKDYVAYADAMLADFQATGRVLSLERGSAVLKEAVEKFRFQAPGLYRLGLPINDVNRFEVTTPELVDSHRASTTAQMLRLFQCYGRLLSPGPLGTEYRELAAQIDGACASLVSTSVPQVAGILRARSGFKDSSAYLAVGPQSNLLVQQLVRLQPNRLAAQVVGDVHPELASRAPGVYIVTDVGFRGPYTVEEAARQLPVDLVTGL